jgi:hypothetical protein
LCVTNIRFFWQKTKIGTSNFFVTDVAYENMQFFNSFLIYMVIRDKIYIEGKLYNLKEENTLRKKIIGIFVFTLLIAVTVLPVTGNIENTAIKTVDLNKQLLVQPPEEWNKTFGDPDNDLFFSGQQTSDGYIITGATRGGTAHYNCWLIKTTKLGNEQWNKTFDFGNHDLGLCVKQTSDGYIITGMTHLTTMISDFLLLKTDANGNEQWKKSFGKPGNHDYGFYVIQTSDGGYAITGSTTSYGAGGFNVWLIKTDENGVEEWNRTYGGSANDRGWSLRQTSDSGFIIVGETKSYGAGNDDVYLIKTNANGVPTWSKTYGQATWDCGHDVELTSDGGYIITGATVYDFWIIKTDDTGTDLWNKTFDGSITSSDLNPWDHRGGLSIQETPEGGYITTGITDSYGAVGNDALLIKLDKNGNEQWKKRFGGDEDDEGFCLDQTDDGGYAIFGGTQSFGKGGFDGWLIKIAAPQPNLYCTGEIEWIDVKPGDTVYGSFSIENRGENSSLLDWYVHSDSLPEWGDWTIEPEEGEALTPEDGPFTINVTVVAPEKKNGYTGNIKIINKDDGADTCTIDVDMTVPKSKSFNINPLFQRFFKNHPNLFPLFRQLLGV